MATSREDLDAKTTLKIGPAGWPCTGWYGSTTWDAKGVSKISRIFISFSEGNHCSIINSLQFEYFDRDGQKKITPVYGNEPNQHSGFNFKTVVFNGKNESKPLSDEGEEVEYITKLNGATLEVVYVPYYESIRKVTCLEFETNLGKRYGPIGSVHPKGKKFSLSFEPGNNFAGFFGTFSDKGLTSIGGYFAQA